MDVEYEKKKKNVRKNSTSHENPHTHTFGYASLWSEKVNLHRYEANLKKKSYLWLVHIIMLSICVAQNCMRRPINTVFVRLVLISCEFFFWCVACSLFVRIHLTTPQFLFLRSGVFSVVELVAGYFIFLCFVLVNNVSEFIFAFVNAFHVFIRCCTTPHS